MTTRPIAPVLLTVAVLTGACGGGDGDAAAPEVASLPAPPTSTAADPTPSSGEPAVPAVPAAGRPRFRVDDTVERRDAIWDTYYSCMVEHGTPQVTGRSATAPADMTDPPAEALAACDDRLPVFPKALEAATNPDFAEERQAYVQCMADDGLHVTLVGDPDEISWTFTDAQPVPEDDDEIEQRCLVEAFGAE